MEDTASLAARREFRLAGSGVLVATAVVEGFFDCFELPLPDVFRFFGVVESLVFFWGVEVGVLRAPAALVDLDDEDAEAKTAKLWLKSPWARGKYSFVVSW